MPVQKVRPDRAEINAAIMAVTTATTRSSTLVTAPATAHPRHGHDRDTRTSPQAAAAASITASHASALAESLRYDSRNAYHVTTMAAAGTRKDQVAAVCARLSMSRLSTPQSGLPIRGSPYFSLGDAPARTVFTYLVHMLDRFGEDARQVVMQARSEASGLLHDHVGTEHLLLGLMGGEGTPASEALAAAGASVTSVRQKVIEALASRTTRRPPGADRDLPFTDRASRALDRAGRLSLRTGSDEVRAEHILLSLLTVEGTAGQVLRGLGVDPDAVKEALVSPGEASSEEAAPPGGPEQSPRRAAATPLCASCGASLATSLERASIAIGSARSGDHVDVYYCRACGSAIGAAPGGNRASGAGEAP